MYPPNLPVVEVCAPCNQGFSRDEQYFVAFLSAVLSGSTEPDAQFHPGAAQIFENQPALRARVHKSGQDLLPLSDRREVVWTPEVRRINRVILKNARGHAYFEYSEPMLEQPSHVWFAPLQTLRSAQKDAFETSR